jgi:hypothetical protein
MHFSHSFSLNGSRVHAFRVLKNGLPAQTTPLNNREEAGFQEQNQSQEEKFLDMP